LRQENIIILQQEVIYLIIQCNLLNSLTKNCKSGVVEWPAHGQLAQVTKAKGYKSVCDLLRTIEEKLDSTNENPLIDVC